MHRDVPAQPATLRKNDYVIIRDDALGVDAKWKGVVYQITKVNTTTFGLQRVDTGGGAGVRVAKEYVDFAPAAMLSPALNKAAEQPTLHIGNLVKVIAAGWKEDPDRVWIVTRNRVNGYDIAAHGGSNGQYYPEVPRGALQLLTADQYELILK